MKIAVGSDHGGIHLKNHIREYLTAKGIEVLDCGTYTEESTDYPDYAAKVCQAINTGEAERGILVCGTGIGISIAANKIHGIRAALCGDVFSAQMSREHNNANVLCMGERVIGVGLAEMITDTWLQGEFAGGRHERRVDKIAAWRRCGNAYCRNSCTGNSCGTGAVANRCGQSRAGFSCWLQYQRSDW